MEEVWGTNGEGQGRRTMRRTVSMHGQAGGQGGGQARGHGGWQEKRERGEEGKDFVSWLVCQLVR